MTTTYKYPLDLNGLKPSNKIPSESHKVTAVQGSDFMYVVPEAAPYFEESMEVYDPSTGDKLTKHTDWVPGWYFEAIGKTPPYQSVYGAVVILNTDYVNKTIELRNYQTLGGEYVLTENQILTYLANTQIDPRNTTWDSVTYKPGLYDPERHLHNINEMLGFESLVAAVKELKDTLTAEYTRVYQMMQFHVQDKNNPHLNNLTKLGIERFSNVYKAEVDQVLVGENDRNFITPAGLKAYFEENNGGSISDHVNDKGNPHGTTKAHVGLGNLQNWRVATVAEALSNRAERYLSVNSGHAIVQNYLNNVLSHIEDNDNPHGTTKEHVQLGNVQNYGLASIDDVMNSAGDKYVTAQIVKEVMDQVSLLIQNHIQNSDNPHQMTKSSIDLGNLQNWRVATIDEAMAGADDRYLSADVGLRMVNRTIQNLPIGQINTMAQQISALNLALSESQAAVEALEEWRLEVDAALAQYDQWHSAMFLNQGKLFFGSAQSGRYDYDKDSILNDLYIATSSTELSKVQNSISTHKPVFENWQRLAWRDNNPVHDVNELTSWNYDSTNDRIYSTINSSTVVGLLNPKPIIGDYTFEVALSSNAGDDDVIGLILGAYVDDTGLHLLTLRRSASVNGAAFRLRVDDTVIAEYEETLESSAGGWMDYSGDVNVKATLAGRILTLETSDPGTGYLSPMVVNLDDNELSIPFGEINHVGLMAFSQSDATFKIIRCTELRPRIAATHTNQVFYWDGDDYIESSDVKITDVIKSGRMYRDSFTDKIYWAPSVGTVTLVNGPTAKMLTSSNEATAERILHSDENNVAHLPKTSSYYADNGAGTVTYQGKTVANDGEFLYYSRSGEATGLMGLASEDGGFLGGFYADGADKVGFVDAAKDWLGYFDADKKFYHYGMVSLSDESLKENKQVSNKTPEDLSELEGLFEFVWKDSERVPKHMRGRSDIGTLAQRVQMVFPNCVSECDDGILTVDESKLALAISLVLLKDRIENK